MNTSLLRLSLRLDAIASGAMGLLAAAAAAPLSTLLNLPQPLLVGAGVALLPFAAFVAWTSMAAAPPRTAVWSIVLINVAWVIASFGVLLAPAIAPNMLGVAFIVAQALAVLAFAGLQATGLTRTA